MSRPLTIPPITVTFTLMASGKWLVVARRQGRMDIGQPAEMSDPVEAAEHVVGLLVEGIVADAILRENERNKQQGAD